MSELTDRIEQYVDVQPDEPVVLTVNGCGAFWARVTPGTKLVSRNGHVLEVLAARPADNELLVKRVTY